MDTIDKWTSFAWIEIQKMTTQEIDQAFQWLVAIGVVLLVFAVLMRLATGAATEDD